MEIAPLVGRPGQVFFTTGPKFRLPVGNVARIFCVDVGLAQVVNSVETTDLKGKVSESLFSGPGEKHLQSASFSCGRAGRGERG